MNTTINTSPHVLMDVASCDSKAWVRHVRGYTSTGEAIKAVAGQAFHAGVAEYLQPREGTGDESVDAAALALKAFHTIYDPAYGRLAPEKLAPELTPANLHRVLSRWIEMHPAPMRPWKRVLAVEKAFESRTFTIETSPWTSDVLVPPKTVTTVRLICRPDLVVEDHNGMVRWVDTKTTGWRIADEGWRQELRLSLQVQLYSDAIAQKYGAKAIYGGWINAIELRKLPGDVEAPVKLKKDGTPAKARVCGEHGRPFAECGNEHAKAEFIECLTTQRRVERAVKDAEESATRLVRLMQETNVDELNTRGSSNRSCRFCPAANWCENERPTGELAFESFKLIYDPWVVEEGTR
jgi:hypothetical protein